MDVGWSACSLGLFDDCPAFSSITKKKIRAIMSRGLLPFFTEIVFWSPGKKIVLFTTPPPPPPPPCPVPLTQPSNSRNMLLLGKRSLVASVFPTRTSRWSFIYYEREHKGPSVAQQLHDKILNPPGMSRNRGTSTLRIAIQDLSCFTPSLCLLRVEDRGQVEDAATCRTSWVLAWMKYFSDINNTFYFFSNDDKTKHASMHSGWPRGQT